MSALWILLLPMLGAVVSLGLGRAARAFATFVLAADIWLLLMLILFHWQNSEPTRWIAEWSADWVPQLGIRFALGVDGLALVLSLMACIAAAAALIGTPGRGTDDGLFCAWFLAAVAGVLGVFLATDLMLFFVFFEVMLLPAYVLIARWGTGDKRRAAIQFFVFTQAGGLLMLIAIAGLHAAHFVETGVRTFDYATLTTTPLSENLALLFLLGFALAFAVKLPLVPFHTWQPLAYSSGPIEAAILLSALMAKTAGYGLLRFALPMFPAAAETLAPWAMAIGLLTIVYAGWLAYGQRDLVRLIAYSSAGHLGYVVLGVFAMNELGRNGAIVQMFCHGLSVTGMFLIAAHIERCTGTRDLEKLGGLWHSAPRLGGIGLIFVLATLGLPGLGNFIGEFLALAGTFQAYPFAGAVGAIGAVLGAAYALRALQRSFFGPRDPALTATELPAGAWLVCAVLVAILIWVGFQPGALIDLVRPVATVTELALGVRP